MYFTIAIFILIIGIVIYDRYVVFSNKTKKLLKVIENLNAEKIENVHCNISTGLSWNLMPFNFYFVNGQIILIESLTNMLGRENLKSMGESYFIEIKKNHSLPIELFKNKIVVSKIESIDDNKLFITGELSRQSSLSFIGLIPSGKIKIEIRIRDSKKYT